VPKIPDLWLRRDGGRRLRGGHCWIYSNEIDSKRSPLNNFAAGDIVTVRASDGKVLASAYMEPQSLICARRFSGKADQALDTGYFCGRIDRALALRQRFYKAPFYRLIYGDSDGLSGVVVDRYGDYLVLQLNTAGIECHEAALVQALVERLHPTGILLRADSRSRREQGLEDRKEVIYGQVPEQLPLQENGVNFLAPVVQGQKTGWFYDHRSNRARLRDYIHRADGSDGCRMLDVFSYVGGWGVQAAAFGASRVCCVDSSQTALDGVVENARLNNVQDRVEVRQGQATRVLEDLLAAGEQFDLVVVDPPAFIQRKRDMAKGCKAYQRINELALRLLVPGGTLVSASCSMHLAMADLIDLLRAAALRTDRELQLVEMGHQGPDHPIHAAIPETNYLKAVFAIATLAD
jgi:23S rRNA (cytosine1962-C5)-methyltransferase